jgi:V/A-type H+-transporting ATPase subunit I
MRKIDLLVLARDLRAVTRGLGELGVVHLAHARAGTGTDVPPVRPERRASFDALLGRVERLMVALEIPLDEPHAPVEPAGREQIQQMLKLLEDQHDRLRHRLDSINGQLEHLRTVVGRLRNWEALDAPVQGLGDSSFLHVAVGSVDRAKWDALARGVEPTVVLLDLGPAADRRNLMALSNKRGRWALESALAAAGFRTMPEELAQQQTPPARICQAAITHLRATELKQEEARADIRRMAEENRDTLGALRAHCRVEIRAIDAQSYFSATDATVLISGWVPADRVTQMREQVLRLTDGRVVIQLTEPDDARIPEEQIPVQLRHNRWLRPFEVLVSGFGLPGYRQIEPTALVGVTFLLMFGLMFGDVGQGAVLMLVGLLMHLRARREAVRNAGLLVALAGASAFAFGFLYGGVFAVPKVIHHAFEPLDRILVLLGIGVGVGVLIISTGLVLNIVNRLASRDFFDGVFGKFGLAGAAFYWGALATGLHAVLTRSLSWWLLSLGVFVPLGVLLLRVPLYRILFRRRPPHGGGGAFAAVIESGAELIETVAGFLANTISFARVGAFALSHAGLCLVIFKVSEVVYAGPLGWLWAGLVLAFGNALVIGLEGLITAIQIVRLEWYEFFSKFFEPKGKAYRPFTVDGG